MIKKNYPKNNWSFKSKTEPYLVLILLLTINLLSACGGQVARSTPDYFIPPTLAQQPEPIPLKSPTPPPPTTTPECSNLLSFIEDVTVPDGTVFAPGESIEKVWLVENSGSCNWDGNYRLQLVSGNPMGAENIQALFPARSGSEAQLRIVFKAPLEGGGYQSSWQAYTPESQPFGDLIFILIEVDPGLAPDPETTPASETVE